MITLFNLYDSFIAKYKKEKKLYDVFLSHKQSEAQDRAKVYKLFLKEKGIRAFYDKDELTDDDWTIEKVIEMVTRSKCLLFFYTPTILDNVWCQLELFIAIKANIPIFIINVETTWPTPQLVIDKSKIPDYLQPAFKHIILDHRYDFDALVLKVSSVIKRVKTKKRI